MNFSPFPNKNTKSITLLNRYDFSYSHDNDNLAM